jgi:hypothetical protein
MSSGSPIQEYPEELFGRTSMSNGPLPIDGLILFSCWMEGTIGVRSCVQAAWYLTAPVFFRAAPRCGRPTIAASLQKSKSVLLETDNPINGEEFRRPAGHELSLQVSAGFPVYPDL